MKNSTVVDRWLGGRSGHAEHLTSNGNNLWSYNLLIGFTEDDGRKVVLDHTAPAGSFVSQTTSCHVGLAKRWADRVDSANPEGWVSVL